VVDDALQGITHVVRGADLLDNTPRQIALQQALGYATPQYLHTPLIMAADGEKLSKQNGAEALDTSTPLETLNAAAKVLNLPIQIGSVTEALVTWTVVWRSLYNITRE
jgi:glutamyl-Q tRNA(Asp) synthetase